MEWQEELIEDENPEEDPIEAKPTEAPEPVAEVKDTPVVEVEPEEISYDQYKTLDKKGKEAYGL